MPKQYSPATRFFADESKLKIAIPANQTTDSFGPVVGNENTQYRITSKVRTDATSCKVYAICSGVTLIQPATDDNTKVNIILKPDDSISLLKIKYFVYRGVNKSDLIDNLLLKAKNINDQNQPIFLQNIWDEYLSINVPLYEAGLIPDYPDLFPAFLIGYDPENQPTTDLIDSYFKNAIPSTSQIAYQLPKCKKGDHIGNFTNVLGLDIILDDGNYQNEKDTDLFHLDLAFARQSSEYVFKINSTDSPAKIKRYREYILRFLDAAAFWGSHIICGQIDLTSTTSAISSNFDINDKILNKFQTKNNLYIYIQGERERSYNYFDLARKIRGFNATGDDSSLTNEWPILIKTDAVGSTAGDKVTIPFQLFYSIDASIWKTDRFSMIDLLLPNTDLASFPRSYIVSPLASPDPSNVSQWPLRSISLDFQVIAVQNAGTKYCSSFIFVSCNLKQDFPLTPYYKNLWPSNIQSPITNTQTNNAIAIAIYDKNSMKNLLPIVGFGANVLHKLVVDRGIDKANPANPPIQRRLYLTVVKKNTLTDFDQNKLNSSKDVARYGEINSFSEYIDLVYSDSTFSVFKGLLNDAGNKNTLSLCNYDDFQKKRTYFQLGITEDEFQVLNSLLPSDADKSFFFLQEINTSRGYGKYNLGLCFEDNLGGESTVFPATSPVNKSITVYTVDGLYFFSATFSKYQNYYEELSNCTADFRPKSLSSNSPDNWQGEYGIDWIRQSDTDLLFDQNSNSYKDIIGHYYRGNGVKNELVPAVAGSARFNPEKSEFIKYKNTFPSYIQNDIDNLLYTGAVLMLYPEKDKNGNLTGFPKQRSDSQPKCLIEAEIDLKLQIPSAPSTLQIKFETSFFSLTATNPVDISNSSINGLYTYLDIANKSTTGATPRNLRIKVKSIKEFDIAKQIYVLADGKIAGEIQILANSKQFRRETRVILVSCSTKIDGSTLNMGIDFQNSTDDEVIEGKIVRLLNQGLIDVNTIEKLTLDLTIEIPLPGGQKFNFNTSYVDNPNSSSAVFKHKKNDANIHADLFAALKAVYNTRSFDDYFIIFYINEESQELDPQGNVVGKLAGEAEALNGKITCVYRTGISDDSISPRQVNDTSTHELLHTAGLNHMFSNFSPFLFKIYLTSNIMDYVRDGVPSKRDTLSKFQSDVIKKHSLIKPEV